MGTFTKPSKDFSNIPYVDKHVLAAAHLVGAQAENDFADSMGQFLFCGMPERGTGDVLEFDSPLEVAFWVWWQAGRDIDIFCRDSISLQRHVGVVVSGDRYVLDFVVAAVRTGAPASDYIADNWPNIAVELDGHAFHERTHERATYRNKRDRALQQAHWRVFHFSFSEFTAKAEDCLWEVVEHARECYSELFMRHRDLEP